MTDIGFGLIDRRTVIAALLSMAVAQVVLNTRIPLDSTNAGTLLLDLVLLTGYFYLARSLYRLPLVLVVSGLVLSNTNWGLVDRREPSAGRGKGAKFLRTVLSVTRAGATSIYVAILALSFEDWIRDYQKAVLGTVDLSRFFGVLDRVGLVVIAVVATLPTTVRLVHGLGVAGVILMIVVYVFRGNFTALVRDALGQSEQGHQTTQAGHVLSSLLELREARQQVGSGAGSEVEH